jgi:hypothetical protein
MGSVNVITTKPHIRTETSLAYVEAAEVLMFFPKFRIYFVVIYLCMGRICENTSMSMQSL